MSAHPESVAFADHALGEILHDARARVIKSQKARPGFPNDQPALDLLAIIDLRLAEAQTLTARLSR